MKNYITFPNQYINPHNFVLDTSAILGVFETNLNDRFTIKLNQNPLEVTVEHTSDAALQQEFIDNIRQALLAKPGLGEIKVQLPEGFEVTFVEFG